MWETEENAESRKDERRRRRCVLERLPYVELGCLQKGKLPGHTVYTVVTSLQKVFALIGGFNLGCVQAGTEINTSDLSGEQAAGVSTSSLRYPLPIS